MLRGGMAMVLVSGLIGTAGLVYSGMVPRAAFWPSLLTWGMGDLLGIITLAPTLLLVSAPRFRQSRPAAQRRLFAAAEKASGCC
jgi:integral membrane sensor domain MASE1